MAKRSDESLDVLGQSLLSQQAASRKKADKRRRKDQKKLMLMGTLVAGQSLVNSALKRRTKEIADLGEMSKFKSKAQADNMAFYAPIFQSMEGADTYEDWKKTVGNDSGQYRALQGHLSPLLIANAKQQIGPEAADPLKFNREYAALKDTITNNLIESAYGKDRQGQSYKDLFSQGAKKFAASTGVDPVSKDALFEYLTNTTQNSVDAYKAQELNRRNGNFSTSIFSKDAVDTALNSFSFGLIKRNKGESNPFKSISSKETLLPTELQTVFDGYNVNQIIKKEFAANYATMKDEVEAFANNTKAVESMDKVWGNMIARVKRGSFMDFYSIPFSERRKGSGHRHTAHSESMIENVYDFVEDRLPVKTELLNQAGALANMIGDPQRPQMKESIMDRWLTLPEIDKLNIAKGDEEYKQVLGQLDTVIGRQEFALDFATSLSIKNEKLLGFEVDFLEIKSITEPKFRITKEDGINKFEPTDIYNSLSMEDKELHYDSYLQAIIKNQTRSKNTPDQLRQVALQFMQDILPPDGRAPEEVLNNLLDLNQTQPQIGIPMVGMSGSLSPMSPTISPLELPANSIGRQVLEKKKLIDIKIPELHPSIKQNNLIPIMDYHLDMLVDGKLRLKGDKEKNKTIIVNQFLPALFDTESKFNYNAKNTSGSSAYGGGQIVRTSLIPALNRLNKADVKPKEEQIIRENMSRIDSMLEVKRNELVAQGMTDKKAIKAELDELGKIEYFKFMDKANLSESLQQQLVLADLLEKTMRNEEGVPTTGVGDTLWNALFEASTPEAQYRAALEIYYRGHHTKPDLATIELAEERFKPYFLN